MKMIRFRPRKNLWNFRYQFLQFWFWRFLLRPQIRLRQLIQMPTKEPTCLFFQGNRLAFGSQPRHHKNDKPQWSSQLSCPGLVVAVQNFFRPASSVRVTSKCIFRIHDSRFPSGNWENRILNFQLQNRPHFSGFCFLIFWYHRHYHHDRRWFRRFSETNKVKCTSLLLRHIRST